MRIEKEEDKSQTNQDRGILGNIPGWIWGRFLPSDVWVGDLNTQEKVKYEKQQ